MVSQAGGPLDPLRRIPLPPGWKPSPGDRVQYAAGPGVRFWHAGTYIGSSLFQHTILVDRSGVEQTFPKLITEVRPLTQADA